jgi:RNA polymerase sigma-70 factor (ECF subfamily)
MENLAGDDASERRLLEATGLADREAFSRLYRRYEARIYGYVRNFVRDSGLAEDLVVETMSAVWDGASRFDGRSRVSTWIFGVARHKAMDVVRARTRRPATVPVDAANEVECPSIGPFESTGADLLARQTQRALETLSREHREVLRLAYYEELPYEEIAQLLLIPTSTVKTRVFYAKQALKRHLLATEDGASAER